LKINSFFEMKKKKIILKMSDSETIAEEAKINRSLAKSLLNRFPIEQMCPFFDIIDETPDERTEIQLTYLRSSFAVYQRLKKQYTEQMKAEMKSNQEPPKIMQMTLEEEIAYRRRGGVDIIAKVHEDMMPTLYGSKDLDIRSGMIIAVQKCDNMTTVFKIVMDDSGDTIYSIRLINLRVPKANTPMVGTKICIVCNVYHPINGKHMPQILLSKNIDEYDFLYPYYEVGSSMSFDGECKKYPRIHSFDYGAIIGQLKIQNNFVENSRGEQLRRPDGHQVTTCFKTGILF